MGNSTAFCRLSLGELSRPSTNGLAAYLSLAAALEDEGFLNHDEQLSAASGIRPRLLGKLDSLGSFFEQLDAAVRVAVDADKLAFLLWAPSREDVREHWARLPPAGQALAKAGARVLRREEFLELRMALQGAQASATLREDLRFVLEGPPPEPDEIDVWFTQGSEAVELDALPATRGPPPSSRPPRSSVDHFERMVFLGLAALGAIGALAIAWQLFF